MNTERELAALFRAEQAAQPKANAEALGWQRLSSDLAAGVAPMPVSTGALKLATWLVPKWLLLGFAVGLAGAGASAPLFGAAAPGRLPGPPASVAARVASAPPASSAVSEVATAIVEPAASSGAHVARAVQVASAMPSAGGAATFDAELKLISLAKGELDAHRPRQAQAWLAEHAQRFPNGVFAVEREALGILSSCQQGPKNEGAARAFAERHPGSPLVERLERACQPRAEFPNSINDARGPGEPMAEPSRGVDR